MSHRDRSIANMRCEAKRIYNQRRYINKLERQISKAIELNKQIKSFVYNEMVDRCVPGSTELYELVNEELKVLGGNNGKN
jgi:hypothetical protein